MTHTSSADAELVKQLRELKIGGTGDYSNWSIKQCQEAADVITRLSGEVAELKAGKVSHEDRVLAMMTEDANKIILQLTQASLFEALEALKPFADNFAHALGRQGWPDDSPAGGMNSPQITNGHLRRAAQIVAKHKPEEK